MNKNVPGFTLIEVMAALAIVTIAFAVMISFESYLMTSTKRSSNRIERSWAMTNFLYECHGKPLQEIEKDPNKKFTKKIEQPELTLTYQQKPIQKGSDLEELENLIIETVEAEWLRKQGAKGSDRIINIRFKMKETKKKEQGQWADNPITE